MLCTSNATFVFGMYTFITHITVFAQSVELSKARIDIVSSKRHLPMRMPKVKYIGKTPEAKALVT